MLFICSSVKFAVFLSSRSISCLRRRFENEGEEFSTLLYFLFLFVVEEMDLSVKLGWWCWEDVEGK